MKSFILSLLLSCSIVAALSETAVAQTLFGNALSFNGSNQYATITNFGSIIPTNEITVEFWADTAKFSAQSAFQLLPDDGLNRFNVHLNFGTTYADSLTYWDFGSIVAGGRVEDYCPPNSISNWVHYAMVASQTNNYMRIYTNGVLQFEQAGMTPFVRSNYDLQIGGPGFPYNGWLDDFRIWSVARSGAEIQADMAAPLAGNEAGLLVYYKFDNVSGTVLTNSATATGAAFNGALFNGPPFGDPLTALVNTASDSGAGSLRQLVAGAQPRDVVRFAPALSGATIALTSGEIPLNTSLTIDASSLPNGIQLDGSHSSRILNVNGAVTAVLNSLTLTHGFVNSNNTGGAIFNAGTLEIYDSSLVDNVGDFAAAIANYGSCRLQNCTLANNAASFNGGAIDNVYGATGQLVHCTLSGNSCGSLGGAIDNYQANLFLTNCIIAGNSAAGSANNDVFNLAASVVTAGGTNIVPAFDNNGTLNDYGSILTSDPLLAPLGNYGGPTMTQPPLPGSPAIDAALDLALSRDQRGIARSLDGDTNGVAAPDIGAVEFKITPPLAGSYHGLFVESARAGQLSSGFFAASLNSKQKFSATLKLAGKSYSFTGKFDGTGKSSNSIPRRALSPLTVRLFSVVTNTVFGRVSDGTWTADLISDRATFNSTANPAPQAARYTMHIPGASDASASPHGDGFGAVTVGKNGAVTLAAKLADGTAISQGAWISPSGQWPLYVLANNRKALVLSWAGFDTNAPKSFGGTLVWFRQTNATARLYPGGFTNLTEIDGAQYTPPPKHTRIVNFAAGMAVFDGVNFSSNSVTFLLGTNSTISGASDTKFTLTFNKANGFFNGKVTDPVTLKTVFYTGAVDQSSATGHGFLIESNQSASVLIESQ